MILITTFPKQLDRSINTLNAVASYSDQLAPFLANQLKGIGRKLIVLAQKEVNEKRLYHEGNFCVERCWEKNSLLTYFILLRRVLKAERSNNVVIQFEFNVFGGVCATAGFPLLLAVLRLVKRNTVVVVHQVVEDLFLLREHLGLERSSIKAIILRLLLPCFYKAIMLLAGEIIVHEVLLRDRLRGWHDRQMFVVPHGCPRLGNGIARADAKLRLGVSTSHFVIVAFGFLTHYKGSDWLCDVIADELARDPSFPVRLIMAGGLSPNLKDQRHYLDFVSEIYARASQWGANIEITGFVPNHKIPTYFAAADVVVLPYRVFMSASGPLSVAIASGSAFLLSEVLDSCLHSEAVRSVFSEHGLGIEDFIFELKGSSLISKIRTLMRDNALLEKMRQVSTSLSVNRDWDSVAAMYIRIADGL